MKCPSCDEAIASFTTQTADSNGFGHEPRAFVVWAITCPNAGCGAVLGIVVPPAVMKELSQHF